MNVFFYEAFQEEEKELRNYLPAGVTAGFTWKTIQEYAAREPEAGLISIRTQSIIPDTWRTELSGILTRSTGYEHLEKYQQKCGTHIPCGSLPPYCSRAVAEQAMLLWMCLLRKLREQMESFSRFKRDTLTGDECEHKTLLVVGVGNIGHEVVKIGNGLGMDVFGVDIVKKHAAVNYLAIDKGLAVADIIVCAMNLTKENHGFFNYRMLQKAKPGGLFITVSRGELSPSQDLLRLLEEDSLGGVGLDVFNHEKELAGILRNGGRKSSDQEVLATLRMAERQNVILTPHNAFNTHESVRQKSRYSMKQIDHFLRNGRFLWEAGKANSLS